MAINIIQISLPNYPYAQLSLILIIQIGVIVFMVFTDPIQGEKDKLFEMINQFLIVLYILIYFGLASTDSDSLDPRSSTFKARTAFTWLSVLVLIIAILFSLISIYYKNIHILRKIREYLKSIKLMSILRRFRKEGIDLTEPKKPGTWSLKQFSDYLIAKAEAYLPEKKVEALLSTYINK